MVQKSKEKADPQKRLILTVALFFFLLSPTLPLHAADAKVRIKDIATIKGTNANQLIGYGLVVGLNGTGDKNSDLSGKMMTSLFNNLGIKLPEDLISRMKPKNTAVVIITADLPFSTRSGDTIDVTVSSIGDAKNLEGGVLLLSLLKGPDGNVYGSAQGPIMIGGGGDNSKGGGKRESAVGVIPSGGLISQEMEADLTDGGRIVWILRNPDFITACRIAEAINKSLGANIAVALDSTSVVVQTPDSGMNPSLIIAKMGELSIIPDASAKIVINERTGTVVMGADIKILPVVISHGDLSISINQTDNPKTTKGGMGTGTSIAKQGRVFVLDGSATVIDVVNTLNYVGATPKDIITILQALKRASAIQGELEIN